MTTSHTTDAELPLEMIAARVIREYSRNVARESDGDLRFTLTTPIRESRAQLIVHDDERLIRLYVFPDSLFYVEQSGEVTELVARVSDALVFGSLEWDANRHLVYFRNGCVAVEGQEATQLRSVLESSAFALDVWTLAFRLMSERGLKAREACEVALISHGVADPINLSKSVMRHVLTLHVNR